MPDIAHIEASAAAIRELVAAIRVDDARVDASSRVRVRLTQVDGRGFLSDQLFGFAAYDYAESGEVMRDVPGGDQVAYVVPVNHSVSLQVEKTLAFIAMLIERQRLTRDVREGNRDVTALESRVLETDEAAGAKVSDLLRYGWLQAAEYLRARTIEYRMDLDLQFGGPLAPDLDFVNRRVNALRRVYNEFDLVRDAVDRVVSRFGEANLQIVGAGATEEVRAFAERQLRTASVGRYTAHAMRDALVCGNGYLVFGSSLPSVYVIDPTDIEVLGSERFRQVSTMSEVGGRVQHVRFVEQPGSMYGVSMLEPMLSILDDSDVFEAVVDHARRILKSSNDPVQRTWADRNLSMAEDHLRGREDRIRRLLPKGLLGLPTSDASLYFPGSELYAVS